MNEDRQVEHLMEQAETQRRLGNHRGAIELLQRALAQDPDHARAHASLAQALLGARRLPAAQIEMRAALGLDGNDAFVHHVAALVLRAARKLDDAWGHVLVAIEDPATATASAFVLAAQIQILRGDRPRARELLDEALARDASDVGALTAYARLLLDAGQVAGARERITEALEADPADRDAHVVAGLIDLAGGAVASAEQHARFVLAQDANDRGGLSLWTAVKARKSRVLGAWWRLNTWLSAGDDGRQIALAIGMFLVVRAVVIVVDHFGYETLARVLSIAWLALCAYTWIGPALFRKWLQAELETVKLDPKF